MFTEEDKKSIAVAKGSLIALYNKKIGELNDVQLNSLIYNRCIISGGCIASLLLGMKVNDIDVYAKTEADLKLIRSHIETHPDLIKTVDDKYGDDSITNFDNKVVTPNAITLKNDFQLILLGTEADGVRSRFDFTHCQPYYDLKMNKLYISEAQFVAIKNMQLVPNPSFAAEKIKPRRMQKFLDRGWRIGETDRKTIEANAINLV